MRTIRVLNLPERGRIEERAIKRAARAALGRLGERDAEINIVFVSDRRIRRLNRVYRRLDRATDVLAFDMGKGGEFKGDIVISIERARANARRFRVSVKNEISLYVIHGILHLAGFCDYDRKGFREMEKIQKEIMGRKC